MKGLHPDPVDPTQIRENLRILNDVVDELYFDHVFLPGDGVVGDENGAGTPALFAYNQLLLAPSVVFPVVAGAQPAWGFVIRRRVRWLRAGIRLTVEYSATVGDVKTFDLQVRVRPVGVGDVLPVAATLAASISLAGPAIAQTVKEVVFVSSSLTGVIPGHRSWLLVTFFRDQTGAVDKNPNDLHLLAVRAEVLPQV